MDISFEYFPPRSLARSFDLWDCVKTLSPFDPSFVSVTCSAGGSDADTTEDCARTLADRSRTPVSAHVTAGSVTPDGMADMLERYAKAGVRDFVALRGDRAPGAESFQSSTALIKALREGGAHAIRVGGYPDLHPDAQNWPSALDWMKAKIDAGATEIVTLFTFEAETVLRYRDRLSRAGIDIPLRVGVLPITSWARAMTFANACGVPIPVDLQLAFPHALRNGDEHVLSMAVATEFCDEVRQGGLEQLHIYTLNRSELPSALCQALGHTPRKALSKAA